MRIQDRLLAGSEATPGGCWEWRGAKTTTGYGKIFFNCKARSAHRVSWEAFRGAIPDGMCVLHSCDNRICISPTHLFLGTNKDNQDDMYRKGRGRKASGEAHGRAKLTREQVIAIRGDPRPNRTIARDYGISHTVAKRIKLRQLWRHLP
jgi:hypothetical protein